MKKITLTRRATYSLQGGKGLERKGSYYAALTSGLYACVHVRCLLYTYLTW